MKSRSVTLHSIGDRGWLISVPGIHDHHMCIREITNLVIGLMQIGLSWEAMSGGPPVNVRFDSRNERRWLHL